jgi:galactokinase
LSSSGRWHQTLFPESVERLFGWTPSMAEHASGRVNLIGEHTDYNGGFVLPAAIPQRTIAVVARREDRHVRVWSSDVGGEQPQAFSLGAEERGRGWVDYVQGVTWALQRRGARIGGFELALVSNVPLGAGLSSSAALEVSVLRALRRLFDLELDDVTLAKIGQQAEVEFVGAPVGIMDQMAASLAPAEGALFIDTRTLAYEVVLLPAGTGLVVINSGVAHNHAAGDYRTRRAECERAAAALGVRELRDVGVAETDRVMALPEPLGRRARHVVTENARVLEAVAAMKAGDAVRLGELFNASHDSQRDDYEVSVPEVDLLVDLARAEPSVFGARLTGGGFGGSIVVLVPEASAADVAARVAAEYERRSGRPATILVPTSSP